MKNDSQSTRQNAQLADLLTRWRRWLRLRHRSLESAHEEIVQDASADLVEYLAEPSRRDLPDEEVRRIGFTILRRRVADIFRSRAVRKFEDVPLDVLPATDPSSNPEEVETYVRLLRAVVSIIAKLDGPSRELLLRKEASGGSRDKPLTDAERQRLSRLRTELKRQLAEKYGVNIEQILNG